VEYTAVIFQLEKNKTIPPGEFEAVLGKVIAPFPAAVHLLEYLEQNSFICIVISREEPFYLSRILESLCYEAGKEAGMEIRAAAGSPVSGLQEIALSYSQAKTVLRHQIQKGARKALGFQDLELEAIPDYPYLRSELNTLEDAVAQKSSTRTAFIISELVDTIKHENTSYFYAVCLCYDIINIFIREIYRMKNSAAGEIIRKHQMLFLENFDHPVENLIAIVVSLSREAMRILDREQAPSRAASRGNILKFIEGHYRESNFCVQTILDHFGLSFSNLSHLFKSYMGENISSYIGGLKLNYAKELLSTSGMTVGAIAAKLGYFQTSSFIRKFRIAEGMTPGEYRDKRRTEEPGEKETGD
jgi:AraC-like DNA-binding protein